MDRTHGTTRTGYRYGIVPVQELVNQSEGEFTQACTEEGCWLIVQGGDRAMADHRRTVHRDR